MDLDSLGILNGTDKSSLNHGYLRHYERILAPSQNAPITVLEIGVFRGGSLRMWEAFFDHASIIGVDINPDCARHAGGRRRVEIGSQVDAAFMQDVMKRHKPTVVIDDGSHMAAHVVETFSLLYPMLSPGGIYIVEDIHFHAGPGSSHWRGDAVAAPQNSLLRLARLVSCPHSDGDDQRQFAQMTDTVEFFYGGVAIRRRQEFDVISLERKRKVVEQANDPKIWANFALHAYANTRNLGDAVASIGRAMHMEPNNPEHSDMLSLILEKADNISGALLAAQDAAARTPGDIRRVQRVDELRRKVGTT